MGLIAKIKKLFSKKIDTADISDDNVVSLVLNQSIKYGRELEVKSGSVAVFVAKGKVADVFNEGAHKLELGYLPILSRILKLARPDKKGNLPNKFSAELYLINLKQFEKQKFSSFDAVRLKDQKYKNLNVKLQGEFSFEIFSPVDFLEAMLTQYGLLKDKIAKTEIACWVAELAVKKVQKNKPSVEQLHARATECFEGLIDYVNKELFDCGVKIHNIEVTNTIFPKKVFKSVKLDYTEFEQKEPTQDVSVVDYDIDSGQINGNQNVNELDYQNTSQTEVLHDSQNYQMQNQHFESENINNQTEIYTQTQNENSYNDNLDCNNVDNNYINNTQNNFDTIDQQSNINVQTAQNNQINIDPEIIKTIDYKRCLHCGAYNSTKSQHCFNCKSKI